MTVAAARHSSTEGTSRQGVFIGVSARIVAVAHPTMLNPAKSTPDQRILLPGLRRHSPIPSVFTLEVWNM
jgi:hypothetical protein